MDLAIAPRIPGPQAPVSACCNIDLLKPGISHVNAFLRISVPFLQVVNIKANASSLFELGSLTKWMDTSKYLRQQPQGPLAQCWVTTI